MTTKNLWSSGEWSRGVGVALVCFTSLRPAIAEQAPATGNPPAVPPTVQVEVLPVPGSQQIQGKTLYSFEALDMELKAALSSFAKANGLNIVPDNDVTGVVTLSVRDLPLEQMMRALLEAADCTWREEGGLIRIRNFETKTFVVDYLRLLRKGMGMSSATLASGSSAGGGSGGGMGGGGGGMGGGGGGGGMGGGGGGGSSSGSSSGGSSINLTADNPIDFWKELKEELGFLLTPQGKTTMAVNMTAGILVITDRPSALKKVEGYLKGVDNHSHRQVEIETKLYDVTLGDQFQFGIDWIHVAEAYGGVMGFGGATLPAAIGGGQLLNSAVGGLNTAPGSQGSLDPGGNLTTLVFSNFNTMAAINALKQQGRVEVISKPRIRALNNQTALIKVGEEVPFFNSQTTFLPGTSSGTTTTLQQSLITSITVGTILSITPQISADDWVSLDISPVLTSLKAIVSQGQNTAPNLDTKQASTLVRIRDGTTVVIGGLIQTTAARNDRKIPLIGDIPLLGRLFTGTYRAKQKKELVMFVTPHVIRDGETYTPADLSEDEEHEKGKSK